MLVAICRRFSWAVALFIAILSEGIGYMILLIPRRIKQLKDEGRKDANRKWMAWYRRQQAALRAGLPFDEPPPGDVEDNRED